MDKFFYGVGLALFLEVCQYLTAFHSLRSSQKFERNNNNKKNDLMEAKRSTSERNSFWALTNVE